ncbi:hypothetical protein ACQBAR_02850 [Propionibacteriaceae bacterium Y1685]|uniref:hypothetical protein n=1 Tax=Microlunatus sp. Y1700 TaxID=3418487 RepID=UPI003B778424
MYFTRKAAELYAEERARQRATPGDETSPQAKEWAKLPEPIRDEYLQLVGGLQCRCGHRAAGHHLLNDLIDVCTLCQCELFTSNDSPEPRIR